MTDATIAETSTPSPDAGDASTLIDGAAPAAEASATTEAKPAGEVTYEFKMPEGITLDEAAADEFRQVAKEEALKPEQAQKYADVAARMVQRQAEAHANLVQSWVEQVKTDKELGGDKLDVNLSVAKKALDAFGTPELRDVLNMSGLGNHPELIRAFYKMGQAISEDRFVRGAAGGGTTDPAKILFPTMN